MTMNDNRNEEGGTVLPSEWEEFVADLSVMDNAELIAFQPNIQCWGYCPECGRVDGRLNIEREHWFFCERHRTRW